MAGDARLPAGDDEIAEFGRAGYPDLADDDAMAADDDVMGDLNEIIDLGPLADDRVAIGAAIDGGIGADLDIVLDDRPGRSAAP